MKLFFAEHYTDYSAFYQILCRYDRLADSLKGVVMFNERRKILVDQVLPKREKLLFMIDLILVIYLLWLMFETLKISKWQH